MRDRTVSLLAWVLKQSSYIQYMSCLDVLILDVLYFTRSYLISLGYDVNQSWVDSSCDLWDSPYGWDRAPCSACTIPNQVTRNVEFQLRGLCDR